VYTWGANARGQLGLGDMVDRQSPQMVAVRPAQAALLVACGAEHTAIATSGARGEGAGHQLFTAGNAEHGRLGRVGAGEYTTLRVASRLHAALPKRCAIVDLSAGAAHTLVLWRAHRGTRS
jgi:alpha-tubulin suppressor-like RCC1 family protein